MMAETKLKAVREQLGYSAREVITMLSQRAAMIDVTVISPASLKTKLSRWEHGHESVRLATYRREFRDIYGRTNEEPGFPPERADPQTDELRSRLAVARTI